MNKNIQKRARLERRASITGALKNMATKVYLLLKRQIKSQRLREKALNKHLSKIQKKLMGLDAQPTLEMQGSNLILTLTTETLGTKKFHIEGTKSIFRLGEAFSSHEEVEEVVYALLSELKNRPDFFPLLNNDIEGLVKVYRKRSNSFWAALGRLSSAAVKVLKVLVMGTVIGGTLFMLAEFYFLIATFLGFPVEDVLRDMISLLAEGSAIVLGVGVGLGIAKKVLFNRKASSSSPEETLEDLLALLEAEGLA
jgi:hypothetical protein